MKIPSNSLSLLMLLYIISAQVGCKHSEVVNFWSGALQPNSVKVNVKLVEPASNVRLVASTTPDFSNQIIGPRGRIDSANKAVVSLYVDGLSPNTKYYYAIQSGGKIDTSAEDIGSFITPADSAFSFKFTLGSCLTSNSHHPVFNRMKEKTPLFFLQMGDFHYDNPNSAYFINTHRVPYERILSNVTYSRFFRNCPIAYVWDDHDYSGNNSDSTAAGKTNARIAYREYVPHYPFGNGIVGKDAPIYQSFKIGRVYFILTDLRSSRRSPTMMGSLQKKWFQNECLYARKNNLLIAWVTTVPYEGELPDTWAGFASERTEIANFFRDSSINNLFILSGDAHMVAIDDGRHIDFSSGHKNPNMYPLLQAAALNASGSNKGGNYSAGYFPNPNNTYGQYGMVEVIDHGDSTIQVKFTGYRVNAAGKETQLTSYSFKRILTGPTF